MKAFIASIFCLLVMLNSSAQQSYVSNQILVQLEPESSEEELRSYLQANHWINEELELLFDAKRIYRLYLNDRDAASVLEELRSTELFEHVQLNHTGIKKRLNIPNDGNFSAQWYMRQINAPEAWDIATGGISRDGKEIVIAVVDEGFDIQHLDLDYYINPHEIPGNGIDDDQNGYVDDVNGWNAYDDDGNITPESHGTLVSGVAAAKGNNREGIAGVSWNTKILPVMGLTSDEATVVKAYDYVYKMRKKYNETNGDSGAYVVVCNSSFGIDRAKPQDYPLWCGMFDSMGEEGVLSVAATANWSQNVDVEGDIPTTCPSDYLIAVTSSNRNDELSSTPGAAFGPLSIDIAAPGVDIFSTTVNSNYSSKSGTSYAAPMIAGSIGLMYSTLCDELQDLADQDYDSLALVIKDYLLNAGVDTFPAFRNKLVSGGRLNLEKAVHSISNCYPLSDDNPEPGPVGLSTYPNPNDGIFWIEQKGSGIGEFSVMDLSGRVVLKGSLNDARQKVEIHTPGVYLISFGDQTNQNPMKVVVY